MYLKLHPTKLAWLVDTEHFGTIDITSNLIETAQLIHRQLEGKTPESILIEKPFLKLLGDNAKRLADDIIHIQRTFGVILYILDLLYPDVPVNQVSAKVARERVYGREYITKDTQLTEVNVLLHSPSLPPLSQLCLHDCLVLLKYEKLNE